MEAVAAVEDAFLRGEWTQALNDSRSILAARIVQVQQHTLFGSLNRFSNLFNTSFSTGRKKKPQLARQLWPWKSKCDYVFFPKLSENV